MVKQVVDKCVDQRIPYAVMLELTYRCNLSCKHCFIEKDKRNQESELSLDEIKGILDQLVEMGTFFIGFTGGEIFIRDDLFDIARYAKKRGFLITFMTNGTLITPEMINEIKKIKPLKFEISLYGATSSTHDHITGVDGSFETTVQSIKALTGAGVNVVIKSPLMNLNIREYEKMKAFSEKLGNYAKINPGIIPRRDGSSEPMQYDLSFDEMDDYLPANIGIGLFDYYKDEYKNPSDRLICKAGLSTCSISPDGNVFPCILMPIELGNLKEKRFKEIWHIRPSESLKKLRSLSSRDIKPCYTCDLLKHCIRCPGTAYLETGNLLGISPSACRYAKWKNRSFSEKTNNSYAQIIEVVNREHITKCILEVK